MDATVARCARRSCAPSARVGGRRCGCYSTGDDGGGGGAGRGHRRFPGPRRPAGSAGIGRKLPPSFGGRGRTGSVLRLFGVSRRPAEVRRLQMALDRGDSSDRWRWSSFSGAALGGAVVCPAPSGGASSEGIVAVADPAVDRGHRCDQPGTEPELHGHREARGGRPWAAAMDDG